MHSLAAATCEQLAEKPGGLPSGKWSEIWTVEDEERFMAAARLSLQLAFTVLLFIIQRPSDVLAMTHGRVTKRAGRLYIALRQQKTDVQLDLPVHTHLAPILRERLADPAGLLLIQSPRCMAWARRTSPERGIMTYGGPTCGSPVSCSGLG